MLPAAVLQSPIVVQLPPRAILVTLIVEFILCGCSMNGFTCKGVFLHKHEQI